MRYTRAIRVGLVCMAAVIMALLFTLTAEAFGTTPDDTVFYNRSTTVYPVMNQDTSSDLNFWSKVVGADNDSVYNIAPAFIKHSDSEGASSMPYRLYYGTTFTHKDNDETYAVYYEYRFEDGFWPSVAKGDFSACLVADLTNDRHWNFKRHQKTWTAYPTTWLTSWNGRWLVCHDTEDKDNDTTVTLGRNQFAEVGVAEGLSFGAVGNVCTCGSSEVSSIGIMLADTVGPKVTSINVWRFRPGTGSMQMFSSFKAGDTLYINLKFDEPIRFADDRAMPLETAPKLKLLVKRIKDNVQEPGIEVEASLVSLDSNILTFKYVVPETLPLGTQTVETNHYIYAIAPYSQQTSWVKSSKDFDLRLFGKNTVGVNYLSVSSKTTSRIVDLAGNPIETKGSKLTLNSPAYMDGVSPTVRRIDVARPSHKYSSPLNNSDVFAAIGEKIGFLVSFSEEIMYIRKSDGLCETPWMDYRENGKIVGRDMRSFTGPIEPRVLAELNVSKGGTPVTAVAKYIAKDQDGKSQVYFELEEPISSDMTPIIYAGGERLPIGINRIYMDAIPAAAIALGDARGNYYDPDDKIRLADAPEESRMMPAQQLWLDTTKPTAATTQVAGGSGRYDPVIYPVPGGERLPAFCFPVTVSDLVGYGEDHRSLTNNTGGLFMWRDNTGDAVDFAYEYAVSGSPEQPSDEAYQPSLTDKRNPFTQIDSGNYIHVRLLDDVAYNIGCSDLVIYPTDYAGNMGEVPFTLNLSLDKAGPKINMSGYLTNYAGINEGSIVPSITLRDVSAISSVEYQWTPPWPPEAEGPIDGWTPVSTFDPGSTYNNKSVVLAKEHLATGKHHKYTLHVRGTDTLGYSTEARFDLEYDLSTPNYNIEFATEPTDLLAKHSAKIFLTDSGSDYSPPGVADEVWALIKKPGTENSYWMRRFGYGDLRGEARAVDVLNVDENAAGWTFVEVTEGERWYSPSDEGEMVLEPGRCFEDVALTSNQKMELYALLNQWYGQVEMTIIARRFEPWQSDVFIFDHEVNAVDTYAFNMASGAAIGAGDLIHEIEITTDDKVRCTSYHGNPKVSEAVPNQPVLPRSLGDVTFSIDIWNWKTYRAYGIRDIDFDSPDTRFVLLKTGEGASDTPLFTAPLSPSGSQDIVLPTGVATAHGSYKVVVSVKSKSTGHIDTKEYDGISIDGREAKSYGVSQVKSSRVYWSSASYNTEVTATDYVLSLDKRPTEIFLSADPSVTQTITFESDLAPLIFGSCSDTTAFIKVWSATAADYIDDVKTWDRWIDPNWCPWVYLPGQVEYKTVFLDASSRDTIHFNYLRSLVFGKSNVIPIVSGENVIKYQIETTSGYKTPVQTLLIHAGSALPEINVDLSPSEAVGMTNGDVTATLSSVSSAVVSPETLQVSMALKSGTTPDGALRDAFKVEGDGGEHKVVLTKNGDYVFYVVDKYHNYGFQKVTVGYIDREGPSVKVTDRSDTERNTFAFDAEVADVSGADKCRLYMKFDDAYCAALGVDPGTVFEVPAESSWEATRVSQSGIYAASSTGGVSGPKVFSVSGAFRYDPSNAAKTVDRTITIYAVDGAGNQSTEHTVTLTPRNEPAEYVAGELADGGFTATFRKPVMLMAPNETGLSPAYAHTKTNLPFFNNGTYLVKYSDIFGDQYEDSIMVDQYETLYSCAVSISETAPTNEDVTVLLNTAFNLDIGLELPESVVGGTITPIRDGVGAVVGASITMSENGTVSYTLRPKDSGRPAKTRAVVISNIDKDPPDVGLIWTYARDVIEGLTAGEITVSLDADEALLPLLSTGTTHTFTLYDQEPYTFHYSDIAGNSGSIAATPPAVIVEKTRVELDVTPPDYEFSVFKSENGVATKLNGYTKAEYEALYAIPENRANAFPLFSGVLQLRFQVFDENQTVISIKEDPSAPVSGVVVRGNTVKVSENGDFTLVITDANGNETEVPVTVTGADNVVPTGTITYVDADGFGVRGYLAVTDDRPGQITVKNTSGVLVETEGEHKGKYYHEFLDNESFTFVFTDAAGNIGSVVAAVTTLDTAPPAGTVSQWVPYYVDANGIAQEGRLSDKPTNSDVSVYIRFSKSVHSLTPTIVDEIGSLDHISITQTLDSATVVFRQNAKVRLSYTALNTRSGITVLEVGIIDKTAPDIAVSGPIVSSPESRTYEFTSDEDVFFEDDDRSHDDSGRVRTAGTWFTKVFELNGVYDLRFTDLAGNSTVKTVEVTGIDRVPPGITVKGLPATKEDVAAHNLAYGTSIEHKATKWPVVVTASMNEKGRITFRGVQYLVNEGQSVSLTIDNNGTYEVVATDLVGLVTRYQFNIDCIDKAKPQILVPGGALLVRQGTSTSDFRAQAKKDIEVIDNYDLHPDVQITRSLTDTELDVPGMYSIEVTARDSAGNEQVSNSFVRVYYKDMVEVRVNGDLAMPGGTLFVAGKGSRVINVTVGNLPTGEDGIEPYKMYWKQGLNTPGQMKNAAEFSGSFTAPKDGFYTLYIVTQSRESIHAHIYLQR